MAKKTGWRYRAGEKGRNRVRAYEDEKTGIILLEFYEPVLGGDSKRKRISTGHRDRERAKRQADELVSAIGKNEPPPQEELTLRKLVDIYLGEVTPTKGESKRRHDHRCAEMFLRFLGASRKPGTLNRRDWDRFILERRRGSLRPAQAKKDRQVGNRVIAYDLKWLLGILNWATLAGDGKGGMLLDRNTLKGLPVPKEENPRRPLVLQERYEVMLAVADQVDARCGLALVLAYETGHRIASIRQLRWSDVDLRAGRVRWRAENDKLDHEHVTPLTPAAIAALEEERRKHPAVGDAWVFPSPTDSAKPCSRNLARDWWYRLEKQAKLDHVPQMGWHSFRRTFTTELKGTNLKDLSALGGWKSPQTILTCYMQADEESMREALGSRKRLISVGGL